jgi:hypothetical protein
MKHLLTSFASHVTTNCTILLLAKGSCPTFSEQNSWELPRNQKFLSKSFLSKRSLAISLDRFKSENNFQFSVQKVTREQKQSLVDLDRLDSARKRLQENYQEAQNGKLLSLCLILHYRQTT